MSKQMKICLYPYTEGSGIGTYVIELANALKRYTKEEIIVIGDAQEEALRNKLQFYSTPLTRFSFLNRARQLPPISYIDPFFFGKKMSYLINSIKPDIFHIADHVPYHTITAPVVGVGWDFPKGLREAWRLAKSYSPRSLLPYRFLREMEMSVKDYYAMKKVKTILGVTQYVTDQLRKRGYPVLYFPPGITLPQTKTKKKEALTMTFVGRHHVAVKRKGLRYLLDALLLVKRQNPSLVFTLELIGEIPSSLTQFLVPYSPLLPHIKILGLLSREQTGEHTAQSHLLIAPSLYDEFGYVVLEAQAVGTAALVSLHNHAFQELVANKELAINIFDTPSFATQLEKLMKDKKQLIALGKEAQHFVKEKYSWEKRVPEVMRIYAYIISSTTTPR